MYFTINCIDGGFIAHTFESAGKQMELKEDNIKEYAMYINRLTWLGLIELNHFVVVFFLHFLFYHMVHFNTHTHHSFHT